MSFRSVVFVLAVLTLVYPPKKVNAQQPTRARLIVTVKDQSGAILPAAKVTVVGQDEATRAAVLPVASASAEGVATLDGIAPGRYTIQAEFPGFETMQVRDYRVRAGENRRVVTLPIKKVNEDVTVGRDKQSASLDPRGNAFSTVLTREQIAMLPDDPDEMEAVLKAMSPPGASIRIDGFTGGRLPPKSQIRSIRLPRTDQFAAQNHGSINGLLFIDIMTQPGNGPLRGGFDFTFRDDGLNARNPFTPIKGVEELKQGGASVSGTIVPNKSSFSFTAQHARQYDSGTVLAALPGSTAAQAILQPTERSNYSARFDQATTKDRMLRFSFTRNEFERSNLGVGAYDLAERAYSSSAADNVFRVSENGPLGRRFFNESRLQVRWTDSASRSAVEAQTIRVNDAFTMGGAQQSGGREVSEIEAASDLDFVRGSHSYRAGLLLEAGRYRSNDIANYLGTFTFASLADYAAGRPSNYTRRIGDPNIRYSNVQMGAYVQDDYRVARSLLLSYGVRYEAQTLIPDQNNWSPRFTATWSPLRSGKTTLRAGYGFFSDWVGTSVYEQTLKVDGERQREVNILNPSYPDPGGSGRTPPTNKYLLNAGLILPESTSVNAGLDQQISQALRFGVTYTHRRGSRLLRGRNLNAPVDGVRPDLDFSNVLEVVDDGESRTHSLGANASLILLNWHQTFFSGNYSLSSSRSNTTGALSLPANGDDLSTEWGQTSARHRAGASFSTQPIRDLGVSLNLRGQSGTPYNVTTGRDDNGDGLFNDRPAGTARNSARATAQWDLGLRVSYAIGFGPRRATTGASGGGGPMVVMAGGAGGGGGMAGGFGSGASDRRYRLDLYASAQNVTNRRNYVGYSGVMTSPFFGQATNVLNPRKVEVGMRVGF
jgi:hypothetical protein